MKIPNKFRIRVAALATIAALCAGTAYAATVLYETGSSLLYPLLNIWVPVYMSAHPGIVITTKSTGSGAGIVLSIKGLVQIGASDAYLSDIMAKEHPGILCIALAISSQAINYNLPGLNDKHIQLSGPLLAGIYLGKITKWNDPAIQAVNPGIDLPDHVIIPVHRLDESGDTFIFTQYLSDSTSSWAQTVKFGTSVSWRWVEGGLGANGNSGVVAALTATPYAVAYVGISYAGQIAKAGLGVAMLENASGQYVLPNAETVGAAAESVAADTPPDERVSMIYAKGANAYPIANYEYAIVKSQQPDSATTQAVRDFLTWAITNGNDIKYLSQVHFLPLPQSIVTLSKAEIAEIQ